MNEDFWMVPPPGLGSQSAEVKLVTFSSLAKVHSFVMLWEALPRTEKWIGSVQVQSLVWLYWEQETTLKWRIMGFYIIMKGADEVIESIRTAWTAEDLQTAESWTRKLNSLVQLVTLRVWILIPRNTKMLIARSCEDILGEVVMYALSLLVTLKHALTAAPSQNTGLRWIFYLI